jgi:hypothetical protein
MWCTTMQFRQSVAMKGAAALCMREGNRSDGPDKAKTSGVRPSEDRVRSTLDRIQKGGEQPCLTGRTRQPLQLGP